MIGLLTNQSEGITPSDWLMPVVLGINTSVFLTLGRSDFSPFIFSLIFYQNYTLYVPILILLLLCSLSQINSLIQPICVKDPNK